MRLLNILLLAITAILVHSCSSKSYRQCNGATWGTTFHIIYNADRDLRDSIHYTLHQVELSLSPFYDSSIISQINQGKDVKIDSMITVVFSTSQEINAISHGAFDPTVSPLINLWGFGYKTLSETPSQEIIDSVLQFVGINDCHISKNRIIKKHEFTEFNFSAITKGYGCDMIGEMFKRNNCTDYMIEIGGEIALSGKNKYNHNWNIMIDAPIENNISITHNELATISVTDCGIATSGNYRNFRNTNHGKTNHTIDPQTGMPINTSTLSVTIISTSAMRADALATACMAMPMDKALKMIENDCNSSALFVISDSVTNTWTTYTTSLFPTIAKRN